MAEEDCRSWQNISLFDFRQNFGRSSILAPQTVIHA